MLYKKVPEGIEVANVLKELGNLSTAVKLCDKLESRGLPRRDVQLGIQRAIERKFVLIRKDLMLFNE